MNFADRVAWPANRTPIAALLVANTVSLLGSVLTIIAIPWFVLQTTGSASRAGVTGFAAALPIAIAAFFGGAIVDRIGFKRASVIGDLFSGMAIAAIPLLYYTIGLAFWELLALVFLANFFDTPGRTARQSLIPDLAGLAGMPLERANAAFQAVVRFSDLVGPIVAGILIAALGASNVLWFDAGSFLFSAVLVGALVSNTRAADRGRNALRSRYLGEVLEGLRFVRSRRLIRAMVLTIFLISFVEIPFFGVVLPVWAKRVRGSAFDLGVMLSALGAGALLGVLIYGAAGHRLPRRATFIAGFVVFTFPVWVMAAGVPFAVVVAVLLIGGFAAAPLNPLAYTALQERVPAELRGRVFGMVIALGYIAAPPGLLLGGYLIDAIGLRPTLVALGGLFFVTAAVTILNPAFRELDAPGGAATGIPDNTGDTGVMRDASCVIRDG